MSTVRLWCSLVLIAAPSIGQIARSEETQGRTPRVLFIHQPGESASEQELARLQRPLGIFEGMQAKGWVIGSGPEGHVQLVTPQEIPELITAHAISKYPAVICLENGEIVRSFREGCSTPLDGYTFGWLLNGVMERPQPAIPSAITVPTTGSYPLRGNHWNFEGNWSPGHTYMVQHLRGPNHVALFPASWPIEGWNEEELRSLHDDLHEMGRPRLPLDVSLEAGNSVRPGEPVPIYRPTPSQFSSNNNSRSSSRSSNSSKASSAVNAASKAALR